MRLDKERLHIRNIEEETEQFVPIEDVAVIVCASPDMTVTAGALRRMAELNIPLLITNSRFEPCSISLPYYRPTHTEVLRAQMNGKKEWKKEIHRKLISAKIKNQAAVAKGNESLSRRLKGLAGDCLQGADPMAKEVSAAKNYWGWLIPLLSNGDETGRVSQSRKGINGMLDYGYAVLTSAALRSLAAHGFIAAIGIHHKERADNFPLAHDIVEPLRPWMDGELKKHLQNGAAPGDMKAWASLAAGLLTKEVRLGKERLRLLYAIDRYIQSFADCLLKQKTDSLTIPMLD